MVYDVRDRTDEITEIQFSKYGYIKRDEEPDQLRIENDGLDIDFHRDDLPMLIKALKKAQELWGKE